MIENEVIIDQLASRVIDATEGHTEALDVYIDLYELKSHIEDFMKSVKDEAMVSAERLRGESFRGYRVEISKGGRWDYKHISEWVEAKEELTRIEKRAQEAHKIGANGAFIIDEDGVQATPGKYVFNAESIRLTKQK